MSLSPARAHARAHRSDSLARLTDFLRIPSVSAVPAHSADVRAAAEWMAFAMGEVGLTARIDETAGHPIVYGETLGRAGAPTVLLYGHYDVQPADPVGAWTSPPFEPTVRDGALYARGASDDKGQVLVHVEAFRALQSTGGLPVNVKMVVEGEEEVGSANLDAWLESHKGELAADAAVISDTALVGPDQPSIVVGLRGLLYTEVTVTGPNSDLHSGQYGGAVRNPIHELASLLAAMHDVSGRITIPGFYDKVRTLGDEERAALAANPFDAGAFRAATGGAGGWGEAGYSITERLGARPTLDANGIWGGWTGTGAKTVIPSAAHAKISMRLIADQDPGEILTLFTMHLQRLATAGMTVTVQELNRGLPSLTRRDSPAMGAAVAAYEAVFGKPPVFTLEGGSIPVVASLSSLLGLETVLMGFGLPDDNLHAPNERFRVECYDKGVETAVAFYEGLAEALGL